jgi:hypothetical protein
MKTKFENLISSKLEQTGIDGKFHPLIAEAVNVLMPLTVLLLFSLFMIDRE